MTRDWSKWPKLGEKRLFNGHECLVLEQRGSYDAATGKAIDDDYFVVEFCDGTLKSVKADELARA